MNIVFDIDGTLADSSPRVEEYLYEKGHAHDPDYRIENPDWKTFNARCLEDEPIVPMLDLCKSLSEQQSSGRLYSHRIVFWTGRCESSRKQTENWLKLHGILPMPLMTNGMSIPTLRMRPEGDRTDDDILKGNWLTKSIEMYNWTPDLIFEDRKRIVDMYRSRGIVCPQVQPGDF